MDILEWDIITPLIKFKCNLTKLNFNYLHTKHCVEVQLTSLYLSSIKLT